MRLSVLAPAAVLCLIPLACSSSSSQPNDPNQYAANQPGQYQPAGGQPGAQPGYGQPGYGQPGYTQPGAQPGYTQPGATAPPAGGQPVPGGQPAASSGSATPIAMASALTPVIQAVAAAEVPGMAPEGQAFAGQFQDGQTLEQPLNIQPGKCYSVVAAGMGPSALHIQIVLQPTPMVPPVVLAQDNGGTGANTTLGGKSAGCWKNPTPIGGPGKVILKASGAGVGAAQIFSK
jgi:hypothetical protein